ncbi:hypothetical protein KCMC57_up37390 [Kitasatospora sp. CMC57]|uniref:Uncharacterized protein n=1 Tax=Kitasatospora sp. CMC57 TaxID=3231513 RepID=A0AB33K4F3_9ACTN
MKSFLGKAVVTAVASLALAGVAAPAYAHVSAGGGAQFAATADEPFLAAESWGHASTSHIMAGFHDWFVAGDDWAAGGAEGGAVIH